MSDEANRICPTCGTPAYAHPDRQAGEDAVDIPYDVIERGLAVLRKHFDAAEDDDESRQIVAAVFKAMARDA